MRRIISIIISLVSVLSLGMYIIADAYTNPTIEVSSVTANAGDEVSVIVSVSNNPGIVSMKFNLSYGSGLTLKGIEYSSAFAGQTMQPEKMASPVTLIWLSPFSNCNENGTFATLTFKVKSTAKAGDVADISLSYDPNDVYNLDEANVNFEIINGKISVANMSNVPVTGVTLNKNETTIKTGESDTISATINPENATNKKVIWKSNDETIATVKNGTVTGVSKGSTRVTATTEDGGYMTSCEVTVNCSHKNKTKISAKDSTCNEQGWDEYYVCDDCGQTILSDGTTEVADHPFRPYGEHSGGKATCQELAICDHCGAHYGDYGACNYFAKIEKEEAIKTPGNCTAKAEYYYCCSVCEECEHNDSHTFIGSEYCHSFTNYIYDNNATTENDGTETAKCDYCNVTDTRIVEGSKELEIAKDSAKTELQNIKTELISNEANSIIDEAIEALNNATSIDEVNFVKDKAISDANVVDMNVRYNNVKINVAEVQTINYRSIVTITATATDVPEGCKLVLYVNGTKAATGDNKSVSYSIGELKSDINYTVKVVDANGNTAKDSGGNELSKDGGKITCNAGFFKKLIAFFKGLFKSLPKVEIKP